MTSPAESPNLRILDLEILESDPEPTFVIWTGETAPEFEILFRNAALRKSGSQDAILAQDRAALPFRLWAQALGEYQPRYEFADRIRSAEKSGRLGDWKIVRATEFVYKEQDLQDEIKPEQPKKGEGSTAVRRSPIYRHSTEELMTGSKRERNPLLEDTSSTNLNACWNEIQKMMEMSDIGVFEYNSNQKLLYANEAWYRLSSHPRDPLNHAEGSFKELLYPDDRALVTSMWNTLSEGHSVTFEMRWKGTNDTVQWVLASCVPVLDDEGNLLSIAGNTVDINAQKQSQAAQAQMEALEQARLSELKFARFAQLSPTAIYIYVPESGMNFVNDQFFELTGHAYAPVDRFEWFDLIFEEDVERVKEDWAHMLKGDKSDGVQFRLKKTWVDQDGIRSNIWVESSNYPTLDENGKVINIMRTLFDISHFKWAESLQRRRIEEAWEAKRQQENFIDMTSHELRNPLSAVVQCADSVITSLQQLPIQQLAASTIDSETSKAQDEVWACIESLQTIVSCSLHQKRVIDDVLTLSKLDSKLILITPMRVQPRLVISDAMKMFNVECDQLGIKLAFRLDESFQGMEWAMLDQSRLLQILLNLLTNAIKFTKDRPARTITVTLGGSWTRPPEFWQDISFSVGDPPDVDIHKEAEWGSGREAHIWVKVTDTGCGMTMDEQNKLFLRFSQATPRTHVKYGGSGLGLFISKSLITLQGGAIGVHSEKGVGSTFAFFISTRLAHPPASQVSAQAPHARPIHQRTASSEDATKSMEAIKLNLLIVEDNLVNQKVLKKQLDKFGWNVSVAGDGQEALDWLKKSVYWQASEEERIGENGSDGMPVDDTPVKSKHEVDIILMDIEMPVMNGLTCARLIRDYEDQGLLAHPQSRPPSSRQPLSSSASLISSFHELHISSDGPPKRSLRLPILAVSANARMEQVNQALAAGMDDAISKPFRIPELWPKIRSMVERVAEHVD